MSYKAIDFSKFPVDRESSLKKIYRYSNFDVMLYRSNLWEHSWRVFWITEALLPVAAKYLRINPEKARTLALVHDDAEIITGDIVAGDKAKFDKKQLQKIEDDELKAARALAHRYPKTIHGFNYFSLLEDAVHKKSLEAQLVAYADKFDAYNETLHEIFAGNISLLWSLIYYDRWFESCPYKYPKLQPLIKQRSPFILGADNRFQPSRMHAKKYQHLSSAHTPRTISKQTEFAFYDAWKRMVVTRGGDEGLRYLTRTRERLPRKGA